MEMRLMFGNGRKTIGVFVTKIYRDFQENVCRGICKRAKELGYNVAFFSRFTEHDESKFAFGERNISELPNYKFLDGVILVGSSIKPSRFHEKVKKHIDGNNACPAVMVKNETEGYYNVSVNNEIILEEIIRHFIEHHGYKKINFLAGPKGYTDSDKRLNCFLRVMGEYGLKVEERQIYYGDFWKSKAYNAAMEWMYNPEERPEAIICANDHMAITLCMALTKMGYDVPEDIAVSGCDNTRKSQDYIPSITSVGQPLLELGTEAVNKIYKHNNNIVQEETTYLEGKTYIRESCGCEVKHNKKEIKEKRNHILFELEEKEDNIIANSQSSIDLTGITKIEELDRKIVNHDYLNDGYPSYFMCLFKDWDISLNNGNRLKIDNGPVTMAVGKKDALRLDVVEFDRSHILPPKYMGEEPQFYVFNMLHHQERCFGYTAINFFEPRAFNPSYQGWTINVSNALENIRIHSEITHLVYKLEDLHVKDVMTGIYNRRGLTFGKEYLKQCKERQVNILVISLDIDNLKDINDTFGHACGDEAIKSVSRALEHASEDDEICIRMGGDEFSVIGMEYNEDKLKAFKKKFYDYLNEKNQTEGHDYTINISYGYNMDIPNKDTTLEEYLNIADGRMYDQKKKKRQGQEGISGN